MGGRNGGRKKKRPADGMQQSTASRSAESKNEMTCMSKSVVSGIVTRIDLLEYISNVEDEE